MQFDHAHARDFLDVVYGDAPGLIQVCSTGNWTGRFFRTDQLDQATDYAAGLDGAQGTYFRATTVTHTPDEGKRGGAGHTQATPMMWGDVDFGEVGHKKGEALPPTAEDALTVINEAGLGEPTILVHSGGGLYPFWLLDRHVSPGEAAQLARWTQEALLRASEAHGWTYGTGVSDLARVLRLPGSVNRKVAEPRACRIIGGSAKRIPPYMVPKPPVVERPEAPATPGVTPLPPRKEYVPTGATGPADRIDQMCSWAEILEPAGWTYVGSDSAGELWLRPGGDASSAYSARCFEHNMVCHSESAGLPSGAGARLTKARVYAWLHHGGDVSEAVKALLRGDNRGLPTRVVDEITGATMFGLAPTTAAAVEAPADPMLATADELRAFLTTYTRYTRPDRLGRRIAWMKSDTPSRLPWHARHLVEDVLDGFYPAERALVALAEGLRHHGHVHPAAPRHLLGSALGALLNAKATA
jgi:hypothetical protein